MSATAAPKLEQRRNTFRESSYRLSFSGILRSEWIKLTSVRSIGWSIAIAVALTAGIGMLGILLLLLNTSPQELGSDIGPLPLTATSSGILVSQLVFAVLGVIAMTGEYGSGQIRSSLTAVPTRLPVLGAKALVLGVIAFVASAVALTVGMLGSQLVAGLFNTALASEDYGREFLFTVLGGSAYLALLTVFCLGVGAIVRSGAGAISIALGVLLVLPTVVALVPVAWLQDAGRYLLSNAGGTVALPGTEPTEEFWFSLLALCVWASVALIGAAFSLAKRDA